MPLYGRHFEPGQMQFITTSTYRRTRVFDSDRFRREFVNVLSQVRQEMDFLLLGWVLMPEHCHLLLKAEPAESTSRVLQELKKRTARSIIDALRNHSPHPWCRKMLSRLRLPASVHSGCYFRLWQRRFYPFNIYSEKKRLEKLHYMHNNPVKRGLVSSPDQWPWSSFRFY